MVEGPRRGARRLPVCLSQMLCPGIEECARRVGWNAGAGCSGDVCSERSRDVWNVEMFLLNTHRAITCQYSFQRGT